MRGLREGTRHWVIEDPCEAFFNLRQLRMIPIDWVMYQVKEFLHIKRYSTCQAYGHTANSKECKFATPFCGCCGLRHNNRSCRNDELCCINCAESNRNRGTNYKIRHRSIGKESLPCSHTAHPTPKDFPLDVLRGRLWYPKEVPAAPKHAQRTATGNRMSA
ncbi:hypothetical protein AVEN_44622-1 [Araneus ventricosus]|uniref:Uncharacterized protein n=1 Tax=Araneus ventricosus TaxID=182803 RepID=A0A4Y2WZP9_ARAVE|nr:hypothetical protein AVEN_44622-1 [Araneus ventricosus]